MTKDNEVENQYMENDTEAQEASLTEGDESKVEALEEQLSALKHDLLKAYADTENLRKRAEREKQEALKYGLTNFARDMVGVVDNFSRALEAKPEKEEGAVKHFVEGIELIEKEMLTALERHGVEKINPIGEKFDHGFHQAMMEVESEEAAGTVVQVLQVGYKIHDRLLRPALVGVSKTK